LLLKKKILLISYAFHPSKKVGARRWSKFSKEMTSQGYSLDLITFSDKNVITSSYDSSKYISSKTILKNRYPKVLNDYPHSIFRKISYRIALFKVKRKTNGNFYDRGIFCEKELYQILKIKLKTSNYERVIVTAPPFSLLYYLSKWKDEFNYLLVSDMRDPWINGESYGIKNLSTSRLKEEMRREELVFAKSDIISVPGIIIKQDFKRKYPNYFSKVLVLPHGYSESEFSKVYKRNDQETQKWIYGGTLYPESFEIYKKVFRFVEKNNEILNLDLYTRQNYMNLRNYKGVNFKEFIGSKEFNIVCQESNAFLWCFPEKFKDFFTTKLYELIRCKIPIIYIGYQGQFSQFLKKNRLGIFIEAKNLEKDLQSIEEIVSELDYNHKFPIENYEIGNLINMILR
jgi:hypothetical protein